MMPASRVDFDPWRHLGAARIEALDFPHAVVELDLLDLDDAPGKCHVAHLVDIDDRPRGGRQGGEKGQGEHDGAIRMAVTFLVGDSRREGACE